MRRTLAVLSGCLLPLAALAAGQGEMAITAGPGLALGLEDSVRAGAAADARFLYGLSDSWSARVGLAGDWIPSAGQPATRIVAPTLGVTVAADVLKLVPFAEAGTVLGDLRGGGRAARQRLGGQLGAGIEYLATRHLTVSLLGRVDYLGVRLAGPDQTRPLQLTFALHLGRIFGP